LGLAAGESVDWSIGVVNRPASAVRQAVVGRSRVYLLIVNTPSQCVIGGDRRAVANLVAALGCGFHPLTGVTTVHCEVAKPVADAYRGLHILPTHPPEDIRFYSGVLGRAYDLTADRAADSIVAQAIGPFEFPRVVEQAYADGVRIFVEAGPGNSCTRMISQILGNRPHAVIAACAGAEDEPRQLLCAIAELFSQRVPVDLSYLFVERDDESPPTPKPPVVKVACHRGPFNIPNPPSVPPPENRQLVGTEAFVAPRQPADKRLSASLRVLERISAAEAAKISTQSTFFTLSRETRPRGLS
jgi:acyl transferase domain-containing protein